MEELIKECLAAIRVSPYYTLDLETTGFNPRECVITLISITIDGKTWVIDLDGLPYYDTVNRFREILEDRHKAVIGHNLSFDLQFFLAVGIKPDNQIWDTFNAVKILDEERRPRGHFGLKGSVERRFGFRMTTYEEATSLFGKFEEYAEDDTKWCEKLWFGGQHYTDNKRVKGLSELLKEQDDLYKLCVDLEGEVTKVVAEMEFCGVLTDKSHVEMLEVQYLKEQEEISAKIFKLAGHEFLLTSPKQLAYVLFEELGVPKDQLPVGKSGTVSTNELSLKMIKDEHEIVPEILKYRKLVKAITSFTRPIRKDFIEDDGRIHASFYQLGTTSGRFACSRPNMQQWAANPFNGPRGAYIAPEGYCLIQADYSQAELRLAAYLSSDPRLLHAYQTEGIDIHAQTASLLGITRRQAKVVNFGLLYGMGAKRLLDNFIKNGQTNTTLNECYRMRKGYFRTYSGLQAYYEDNLAQIKADNYVRTITGRRRRVLPAVARGMELFDATHRPLINHPIQGSVGDILKLAMRNIRDTLMVMGGEWDNLRLNSTVHDELIFEVPKSIAHDAMDLIQDKMENAVHLIATNGKPIDMVADVCVVPYWGMSKLDPEDRLVEYNRMGTPKEELEFWLPGMAI